VVTRVGTRPFAALVVAALVAALLAACGSSDSSSTGATGSGSTGGGSTTAESQAEAKAKLKERVEELRKKQEAEKGGSAPRQQSGSKGSDSSESGGGAGAKNVGTPLKVSGGGSAQYRTKGGDNSIQEFGEEGDESELREVAEIVHGFYVARAEEKWDTACTYLSKSNVEQLEQLASQAPQYKNADCGTVLKAFTRTLPAAVEREITTIDAGSFRHDGEQGFLIYYGAGRQTYAMPLKAEGGTWKVTALSGTTLG
jgi:hypothetical protein